MPTASARFTFRMSACRQQLDEVCVIRVAYLTTVVRNVDVMLRNVLKLLDSRLTWLAGDEFTAVDIMCVFSSATMRTFMPFDLSGYP
jgi:glutathione S-transferase